MSLAEHIKDKVHSAAFFDEQRDHWWNRDFLELMARRLQLDGVRNVLDVGCGIGHWGRALGHVLSRNAQVIGIDREGVWVEEARARTLAAGEDRFQFEVGSAERLPFADDAFDLVTCQTVLIYMQDPKAVIAEMVRVTRPAESCLSLSRITSRKTLFLVTKISPASRRTTRSMNSCN